jgi:hypothetical protein
MRFFFDQFFSCSLIPRRERKLSQYPRKSFLRSALVHDIFWIRWSQHIPGLALELVWIISKQRFALSSHIIKWKRFRYDLRRRPSTTTSIWRNHLLSEIVRRLVKVLSNISHGLDITQDIRKSYCRPIKSLPPRVPNAHINEIYEETW